MKKIALLIVLLLTFIVSSCSGQANKQKEENKMKTLVVYYSQSGNTESIAKQVAKVTGADIELLETVEPYTGDYEKIVADAQNEVERNYQRPIKPLKHNIRDYDRIIVGTPTWWYKMASPVLTFLSTNNFHDKMVVPFMTNAGWPGSVIKDMTRVAENNGAKVENAHEFKFHTHSDGTQAGMATPESVLDDWLDSLR